MSGFFKTWTYKNAPPFFAWATLIEFLSLATGKFSYIVYYSWKLLEISQYKAIGILIEHLSQEFV